MAYLLSSWINFAGAIIIDCVCYLLDFFMLDSDSNENLMLINSVYTCISIQGEGGLDLLNNLLISDLKNMQANKFNYSAICNPKGRIISSFWIYKENPQLIYIISPANMSEEMIEFFKMRCFRLKLDIRQADKKILIDKNESSFAFINDENSRNMTSDEFYNFMFSLGLPWIDKNFTESFIPQHLNLESYPGVMSFKKGCYPGQEIIARVKFLGKVKKEMRLIKDKDRSVLERKLSDKSIEQVSPIILDIESGMFRVQITETKSP